jgi:cation:H+ antiporter
MTALVFVVAAVFSLAASAFLVSRLERLGERFGAPEAMLGLITALAADAPEISTAVAALARGQRDVGVGVVIGSNVFNLAALLGLSAVVAGRIVLDRKVVVFEGSVALLVAAVAIVTIVGLTAPGVGLALALLVFVPYVIVSGMRPERRLNLPLPAAWRSWLAIAVVEEELELSVAIHPPRGRWQDAVTAATALVVVVGASVAMERAASSLGARYGVASIITGAIILAAVTSLPNAVAAVYLASRGRGAATLAEALNSNTLNTVFGLLVPAVVIGMGGMSRANVIVAAWYGGLTLVALALAHRGQGLGRKTGSAIIALYLVFVVVLSVAR